MTFQKMVQYIKKKQNSFKILFMGLDCAGKTTVLNTLFNLNGECAPTFGYKIHSLEYNNTILSILDIGGQSCFKDYWNNYFESTDGIVFIVDCSDNRNYSPYLNELLELKIPIAVFINKIDRNPEFKVNEQLKRLEDVECFKTSAFSRESLVLGLDWLLKRMRIVE